MKNKQEMPKDSRHELEAIRYWAQIEMDSSTKRAEWWKRNNDEQKFKY